MNFRTVFSPSMKVGCTFTVLLHHAFLHSFLVFAFFFVYEFCYVIFCTNMNTSTADQGSRRPPQTAFSVVMKISSQTFIRFCYSFFWFMHVFLFAARNFHLVCCEKTLFSIIICCCLLETATKVFVSLLLATAWLVFFTGCPFCVTV